VRADDIELELTKVVSGNADVSQFSDSGIYSVDRLVSFQNVFNDLAGLRHAMEGFGAQADLFTISRDGCHRFKRQRLAIERDHEVGLSGRV
jgi:hypothetical protein